MSSLLEKYGVVRDVETEELWELAEFVELALTQRQRLIEALSAARDALYNGFEPDNQSRAWHAATCELAKVGQ